MTKETPDVEIIQRAEYAHSTETVINEKRTTLSEYKTNSTAVDSHDAASEVDLPSGGRECDRVEQTSQAFYSDDKRDASGRGVALSESQEDTMKEAKEVEEELNKYELPMDLQQESSVHGAICALVWFGRWENTGLATSLNFVAEDEL